ncbi:sugar transferase [uncultured Algibacter sp.]|uniref:sugar transferase n=1 Tax=uncultured Algibacter sp. TaxID=298659 RepID=UPI003217BC3C
MIKRSFDIVFSILGLLLLAPLMLIVVLIIKLDSKGSSIFIQSRVGKNNIDFNIYKFRTMFVEPNNTKLLTLGDDDPRITKVGYFLRRYKIDEFPQLINVLKGDMSFVGPRPELRYYVNFYNQDDMQIFKVKPGITGLATLKFINEATLLKNAINPEKFFIDTIIPNKIKLNKTYIEQRSFFFDIKLIFLSVSKIITRSNKL